MTAQDVQVKILEPMQRVYIPPRKMESADEMEALRDYVETLHQFTAEDLTEAWRRVRETHMTRVWPVPGMFFKFASESRRDRTEYSPRKGNRGDDPAQKWEVWKAVSKSALAQEAVRRGVAWSLKCAVLYDGKKPEQIDLREFSSGKVSAERVNADIENGKRIEWRGRQLAEFCGSNRTLALDMYRNIQVQETRTVSEINYGVGEYSQ